MKREPYRMYFARADGRQWIEAVLDDFQQLGFSDDDTRPGGIILGSDPTCDVVLDGDDVEDFHFRIYGRGHHSRYVDVIAGQVPWGESGALVPGDQVRGDRWVVDGWHESYFPDKPDPATVGEALASAHAIARDADLEGRHAEASAILAEARYRRVAVPKRTALPERLAWSMQLLRIRVTDADGGNPVVHAVGSIERLASGVTIGGDAANDLVLPAAGSHRIRLHDRRVEVLAGTAIERAYYGDTEHAPGSTFSPSVRWRRVQLGDVVVQLCRWPGRREPLR